MVPLDLRHFILRIYLYKLCILISGENEKVFALQKMIQILVGLSDPGRLGGIKKSCQITPEFFPALPLMHHSVKGPSEMIFLCIFSKIFPVRIIIFIVKVSAACR